MGERIAPRQGPDRWVVVMAKEPRAGAVKTRLARDIGTCGALRFYRTTMHSLLRRLRSPGRWQTLIAVSPDRSLARAVWPRLFAKIRQGPGDLGARLQRVFATLPAGPVVIVGTDIPEITASHIARAFHLLGSHDAVFGPSGDGGYWLVGLRRTPRTQRIFEHVRWSSPHTLEDTLANLEGAAVALLEQLDDVDDGTSYRRLGGAGARVVLPRNPG